MVSKSERESSQSPEVKPIQNLTEEDMRRIAEASGGMFFKGDKLYDIEGRTGILWKGQLGHVSLTLHERGVRSLWLKVRSMDGFVFKYLSTVTFGQESIIIQDPERTNPQKSLTIKLGKPNEITLTQNITIGPKA